MNIEKRKIPLLTFAEHPDQGKKCWISLSGCNFNCKGCAALAKQGVGRVLSTENLSYLVFKSSQFIWNEMIKRAVITGGEPTLYPDYLLSLISKLKEYSVKYFEISTNGFLLDENLLNELAQLNLETLIKLDVKAYDEKIHKEYTGKSNTNVLKAVELLGKFSHRLYKTSYPFIIRTVYIPGIVGTEQIEKIAKFIAAINKNVCYRIEQFSPIHGGNISRRPTFEEMMEAYNIARNYLKNVIITTYLPTRPEYNYVEVRADELSEIFTEIDKKSKSVIESWNVKYFTMNQILKEQK
jgi:pyruvate-formate lyase-activating enzyme